jgi:hypothetical protein
MNINTLDIAEQLVKQGQKQSVKENNHTVFMVGGVVILTLLGIAIHQYLEKEKYKASFM